MRTASSSARTGGTWPSIPARLARSLKLNHQNGEQRLSGAVAPVVSARWRSLVPFLRGTRAPRGNFDRFSAWPNASQTQQR
jgi:hypothetical protein